MVQGNVKLISFTQGLNVRFTKVSVKETIEPSSSELSETHLEPGQTPKIALFAKIINSSKQ